MVHTGRPSRGCAVCRRRRIKCDEKSPQCSYCIKTKQQCPGYKTEFDLAWRDQTSVAQKNVERRRKASQQKSDSHVNSETSETASGIGKPIPIEEAVVIVPGNLAEDPETYALSFFFSTYAKPPSNSDERRGFLEDVGPQFLNAAPDSALKMSTMAISSFLFIAWLDRRPDNPLSRRFYLKALTDMKGRLRQPEGCADNDILTSVLLLQMYEVCLSRYQETMEGTNSGPKRLSGLVQKSPHPRAHLDGALALIKHRGVDNFKDSVGQSLLDAIRSQLIDEAFFRGSHLSEDVTNWTTGFDEATKSPSIKLDDINVDLANLGASMLQRAALPPNLVPEFDLQNILEKAQDIERRLNEWPDTLPLHWHPIRVEGDDNVPPTMKEAGLYQEYCHLYPSITAVKNWNRQRVSIIKVQTIIHDRLSLRPSTSSTIESLVSCQDKIRFAADEICASVPFSLGDKTLPGKMGDKKVRYPRSPGHEVPEIHYLMAPALGGFLLLGPLGTVMGVKIALRGGQKRWVGGQMGRIAFIYNIGK